MHVAYAISIHAEINKIGAYLAFAALIGVALLIIMFFVQAHETALLRERAEDAEEDLERLRQYAEQVARQAAQAVQAAQTAQASGVRQPSRVAPPAAAATTATTGATRAVAATGVGRARVPGMPFAPVGVGAPALSSATRLIPVAEATPAPSTPAAATPAPRVAAPTVATAAAVTTAPPVPAAPPAPTGYRDSPPSSRAPRRDYGRGAEPSRSRSRSGLGTLLAAGVLVAVIVVALVLVLTHHSHHGATRSAQATTSTSKHTKSKTTTNATKAVVHVDPTQVRVAVLNGTDTYKLAADVLAKLGKVGFQQGETANYVDATQTSTTVGYLPNNRAQGQAVAKALGVSMSDVHQINSQAEQLVCPNGPSQCSDQVVVTVGANLDSDAS